MRLIHTSDLHLGSPMTASLGKDAAKIRRQELRETPERLAGEAERLGCEGIIIAGDLFDSSTPSAVEAELFLATVRRHPKIAFFLLRGNHDSGVEYASSHLPKNLCIFGDKPTEYKIGEVSVIGSSRTGKSVFSGLDLDRGRVNILVLHGAVGGGGEDSISMADARGLGIDYLALGHYHAYSEYRIDTRGVCVYSGTPEGRGFDEAQECGYVLIDTARGLKHTFVPFAKRRILSIDIDISQAFVINDIEELIQNALKNIAEGSIVRVRLVGTRHPELIYDADFLCVHFSGRFFHLEIIDSTKSAEVLTEDGGVRSLKQEFLRLVDSSGLDEKTKARVRELGIQALLGGKVR
ncbi:MAG: metallophosphoesterase [Clostridia bacterium]|nr:metallophosphoesterase [Clostridia bacterium]